MSARTIILAAAVAQKPGHGGHTWVFLQYLLGFTRLGYRVLLLDRLGRSDCKNSYGQPCTAAESVGYQFLKSCLADFGLADQFAMVLEDGSTVGMEKSDLLHRVRNSPLLLNVMGFCQDEQILSAAPFKAYLDIDPGFPQMWKATGLADSLQGYDACISVGRNIGKANCLIPTVGLEWLTIAPPVVLQRWPVVDGASTVITSIATWRGTYGPVTFNGQTYGLRVHEFRQFARLPERIGVETGIRFELALDIHPADVRDIEMLDQAGWQRRDPLTAAGSTGAYQRYVQQSRAEFCVAKNMYVATGSGWFSDRSACYLASGKPVLAQETGWSSHYPAGQGLLAFSNLDQAVSAVQKVLADPAGHARAAREIAAEFFDSDKVLSGLLSQLGIG